MEFKVKISSLATENIDDALAYYRLKSKTSANNFKKKLSESFKILSTNPYFIIKYREVRAFPIKKFPYIILFDIDNESKIINILSVFCTHQNPEKYPEK